MRELISIKHTLNILTMLRSRRLTGEERLRVDSAIADLRRAQNDPEFKAWLHLPKNKRPPLEEVK
jgi:hypothetical protein